MIANERVVPEFVQEQADPVVMAETVLKILQTPGEREKQIESFKKLREDCGGTGASDRAAQSILNSLEM